METENKNQILSSFDQAYQRYHYGIVARETGFSREELPRAIMESKVSRDQIGRMKRELAISSEDFFNYYYYPGQIIPEIEPKETYRDELVVKLKDRIIASKTFIDGVVIVGCGNKLLKIDNQNGVADVKEIDRLDGFRISLITLLPDGGILYGGWSTGMVKVCGLYQKNGGGYEKKEFPKIFLNGPNEGLNDMVVRPDGKILVETEFSDSEGPNSHYFRYESKNGGYELEEINGFTSDLTEFRFSQHEANGVYYNVSGYGLEVYSEKNKCLRKIDTVEAVTSANLLPNGNIVYATGHEIRILR